MDDFEEYAGLRLKIRYCEADPRESWNEAIGHIEPHRIDSTKAKMTALRKRLADFGKIRSKEHFRTEGDLPDGSHFYALKSHKIRAYGWFSNGVFYISHFAYKKGQKLSKADTNKVIANWRKIEGK